jgi:hypothetical protein
VDIQQRAEALEKEYRQWYNPIPSSWAPMVIAMVGDEDADLAASIVHLGRVDVYKDPYLAYLHHVARVSQILI